MNQYPAEEIKALAEAARHLTDTFYRDGVWVMDEARIEVLGLLRTLSQKRVALEDVPA